jgi:hypothetical protein
VKRSAIEIWRANTQPEVKNRLNGAKKFRIKNRGDQYPSNEEDQDRGEKQEKGAPCWMDRYEKVTGVNGRKANPEQSRWSAPSLPCSDSKGAIQRVYEIPRMLCPPKFAKNSENRILGVQQSTLDCIELKYFYLVSCVRRS